jgi:hypothetical protein
MNSRSLRSAAEFAIGAILPRIQKISGFCVRRDTQADCLLWEWHFQVMRFVEAVAFGWICTVCVCGSLRICTTRRPGERSRNFVAPAKFSRVYNMEAYLIQICGISATNVRQTLHANPSSVDFAQS